MKNKIVEAPNDLFREDQMATTLAEIGRDLASIYGGDPGDFEAILESIDRAVAQADLDELPAMDNEAPQVIADKIVWWAHEENFEVRRGLVLVGKRLGLFDNNPYASAPLLRDSELEALAENLKTLGIDVVASAAYPKEGTQPGYTKAFLLDAPAHQAGLVLREWRAVLGRGYPWPGHAWPNGGRLLRILRTLTTTVRT